MRRARAVVVALLATCAWPALATPEMPPTPATHRIDPERLPSGVALPYPTKHLFRGFGPCVGRGRHRHEAIDLGGVGPDSGVGTPVRSMVKARVVMIGSAAKKPKDFGTLYKGKKPVLRGGRKIPPSREIPGYGKVFFFTALRGKWRTGNLVETVGLEAPLEGDTIRYMHLAAIRPDLKVGDVIEAGEELGLLGGTGVQQSGPHVHIDVRTADDEPIDVAPLLGLEPTATCGEAHDEAEVAADDFKAATPTGPTQAEQWPSGPEDDDAPPIALEPPPPPWRTASDGPALEVAPATIDITDCGMFERVATGPADLRAHLFEHRFLELALAGDDAGAAPALELWDAGAKARLMPGATTPIAVSELPAEHGQPARLRLIVQTTTDVALVIRGASAWHLRIAEKCRKPTVVNVKPDAKLTP